MKYPYGGKWSTTGFTFQSGYIQIKRFMPVFVFRLVFTFQSGYIQIVSMEDFKKRQLTLHSNLVIFKLNLIIPSLISVDFTFQSGYIQIIKHDINTIAELTLHSNLVIFK